MMKSRQNLATAVRAERIAGEQAILPGGVIKSAGRVLQVFELFDLLQRESTVVEIASLLKLPQSSTSMLLRSLVQMGYLHHDPFARTYLPTMSVALLGTWVDKSVVGDGDLLLLMKRLNEQTGQAVVLASRNGLCARYIHVIQATSAARLYIVQGSLRSLTRSGVGYVLLAEMTDQTVQKLALRINSEAAEDSDRVELPALFGALEHVRSSGYAFTTNLVTLGAGVLAMPLRNASGFDTPLVIGIGGVSEVLRAHESQYVQIMRAEIDGYSASLSPNMVRQDQWMSTPAKVA